MIRTCLHTITNSLRIGSCEFQQDRKKQKDLSMKIKNIIYFIAVVGFTFSWNNSYTQGFNGIIVSTDTTICLTTGAELTATFDSTIRETSQYIVQAIPHTPFPSNVGTNVTGMVDDNYYGPFNIGFNFCFFGGTWTQFYVGSNGWISFTPIPASPNYDPWVTLAIPNAAASTPKNCVFGPWRDWYPGSSFGGVIRYQTIGVAPHRKLVVTWIDVALFSCTSQHGTFQIVLHETTNMIDNHLINCPTCPGWNSGNGVQGIQNIAGAIAYTVPGRNNTNWAAIQESHRYIPNGPIVQNFTWVDNFGITYPGQSPFNVAPTSTTTYVARLLNCGQLLTDTVTVTVETCGSLTGSVESVDCFGQATGSASVTIHDGIGPFDFYWSNGVSITGTTDSTSSIGNLTAGHYSVTVSTLGGQYDLDTSFTISQNPQMSISVSGTPESCITAEDGTVTATLVNGIMPFTYAIPNTIPFSTAASTHSFENLISGNYTVTITDTLGCSITGDVFINQLAMTHQMNQSDLLCHSDTNGTVSIDVQGGTTPYVFTWSNGGIGPGLTNLGAGNYCVTVTDGKGCQVSNCVTFTEPPAILLYTSGNQTICLSQSAEIVSAVAGGTPPYSYFWTPGGYNTANIMVEPSSSTEYLAYVRDDNGCVSNVRNVSIFVNPPLTMETRIEHDTICAGDTTTIFANLAGGNGGPYFYEILGGPSVNPPHKVTPDQSQRYFVVGTDGCGTPSVIQELNITVLRPPVPSISIDGINGCPPHEVFFTEVQSNNHDYFYTWDFGDADYFDNYIGVNAKHVYKNPGTYSVQVTTMNEAGCKASYTLQENIVVWPAPTSIFSSNVQSVSVINPTIEFLNQSVGADHSFWIFGDGDSIYTHHPLPHEFPAIPGNYFVSLITENIFDCKDTAYMKIEVTDYEGLFYAPNAINPHSFIQENRRFRPYISMLDHNEFQMLIYNRWGELIFETGDPLLGWDGRNSIGETLPSQTYSWLIRYKDLSGTPYQKKGNISLIY